MRFLLSIIVCLTVIACNKSHRGETRVIDFRSGAPASSQSPPASGPSIRHSNPLKKPVLFELGKPADLKLAGIHDTIRVEHIWTDSAGPYGTGLIVPLIRSFRVFDYQLNSATGDSAHVVLESLAICLQQGDTLAPNDPPSVYRHGNGLWAKTNGDLFVVRNGVVVVADLYDPDIQPDSGLGSGIDRGGFVTPIGASKACLVLWQDSYPCYGPCQDFTAYGINGKGSFVEFPGLRIRELGDLPAVLHENEIFSATWSRGCITYDCPILFDSVSCRFVSMTPDSGFIAHGAVSENAFEERDNPIRFLVHKDPKSNSQGEEVTVSRTDSAYVKRVLTTGDTWWVLLAKKGRIIGWTDEAGFNALGFNDCD